MEKLCVPVTASVHISATSSCNRRTDRRKHVFPSVLSISASSRYYFVRAYTRPLLFSGIYEFTSECVANANNKTPTHRERGSWAVLGYHGRRNSAITHCSHNNHSNWCVCIIVKWWTLVLAVTPNPTQAMKNPMHLAATYYENWSYTQLQRYFALAAPSHLFNSLRPCPPPPPPPPENLFFYEHRRKRSLGKRGGLELLLVHNAPMKADGDDKYTTTRGGI